MTTMNSLQLFLVVFGMTACRTAGFLFDPCGYFHCENDGFCHPTFEKPWAKCECKNGYSGDHCENKPTTVSPSTSTRVIVTSTTTTTTAAPVTTTTTVTTMAPTTTTSRPTPPPTTTINPLQTATTHFTCSKFRVVESIARGTAVSDANASTCKSSGDRASPEALVLANCNVTSPSKWHNGQRVMDACQSIPHYTPVFAIINNVYNPDVHLSGVLVECTENPPGFKMAVQKCGQLPMIEYIIGPHDKTVTDPDVYYIIL